MAVLGHLLLLGFLWWILQLLLQRQQVPAGALGACTVWGGGVWYLTTMRGQLLGDGIGYKVTADG